MMIIQVSIMEHKQVLSMKKFKQIHELWGISDNQDHFNVYASLLPLFPYFIFLSLENTKIPLRFCYFLTSLKFFSSYSETRLKEYLILFLSLWPSWCFLKDWSDGKSCTYVNDVDAKDWNLQSFNVMIDHRSNRLRLVCLKNKIYSSAPLINKQSSVSTYLN